MEKRILSIIIAIVVVVVLVFSIYQFSGESIYGGHPEGCLDTDANEEYQDGLNYYEKGTVTYTNRVVEYTDYCSRDMAVKEYYCEGDIKANTREKVCENGCMDGACVK